MSHGHVSWHQPVAVIMAFRGTTYPCGLIACLRPMQGHLEYHGDMAWMTWPPMQYHPPGTVELRVQVGDPRNVVVIEAETWEMARTEMAAMLAQRHPVTSALERDVLDAGAYARRELEADGGEDYQGAYRNIPHLTPQQALDMIDEAIRATGGGIDNSS